MSRLFRRIGSRLLISCLISILCLLSLALSHHFVWLSNAGTSTSIEYLQEGHHHFHQLLLSLKEATSQLDIFIKNNDPKAKELLRKSSDRAGRHYMAYEKAIEETGALGDQIDDTEVAQVISTIRHTIEQCISLAQQGRGREAERLRVSHIISAITAIENFSRLADEQRQQVLSTSRDKKFELQRKSMYFSISLLMFTLLLNILIWFWLNQTISLPIEKLTSAINRFTGGDHSVRAPEYSSINEIGELSTTFNTMADELEKRHFKLTYQASHDRLTKLVNRREFERRLENALILARQEKIQHVLVMIDLDKFKVVNDTYGHPAGDELLRQIARLLRKHLRKRDTIARLGGDEFALLLECCSPENAHSVLKKLQNSFELFHMTWESHSLPVTASIGFSEINEHTPSVTEALKQADVASYEAKRSGINQLREFRPDSPWMRQRESDRRWFTGLNDALGINGPEAKEKAEANLVLYGQPIRPLLPADEGWHIEVLVRLTDPTGKLIPPGSFLPAAERYQLMPRIDRWVFDNTVDWLARMKPGWGRVAINLSGQSLTDLKLLTHFTEVLQQSTIDAGMLVFEITESAAIANLTEAQTFIMCLRELGCHFALDDFGSGMSSFGYLRHLKIDALKIDGQFVKTMVENNVDLAMVRSINDIAHVMGLKTVAEFVENDAIIDALLELGVDFAQGYGVARPLPLSEAVPPRLENGAKEHSASFN